MKFRFKPRDTFSPKYFTNTNLGSGFQSDQNPDSTKYTTTADMKLSFVGGKGYPLSLVQRSKADGELYTSVNSSPADVYHNFVRSPRLKAAVLKSSQAKDHRVDTAGVGRIVGSSLPKSLWKHHAGTSHRDRRNRKFLNESLDQEDSLMEETEATQRLPPGLNTEVATLQPVKQQTLK